MIVEPGHPEPLGVTLLEGGANVAVFSGSADGIDLCLFGEDGETRFRLPGRTGDVFHGSVAGVAAGQRYGLRAHGPYDPKSGLRFNPAKLLVDPYARQIEGPLDTTGPIFGYAPDHEGPDPRDSASAMPKGIVTALSPIRRHARPRHPWSETVIYEAHVAGLTRLHPDVPPALRGTIEALAHPAILDHLGRIGATAVELLPIQAYSPDHFLVARGLRNYWGYSTIAYMAPHPAYLGPSGLDGIGSTVAALHAAGIEVILDVVYNHTAELDALGPTLSFRGLDNAAYYRLDAHDPSTYVNDTGCGHTVDCAHPAVAGLVLDSLRHWATEYGVDGFRFDLAPVLGRDRDGFSTAAPLLHAITSDPELAGLKIIAEPWDVGPGGYRLGGFPPGWSEWNDQFRDTVRRAWRGDAHVLPDLARVVTGSRELFEPSGRGPLASVNFVACHDGFTLDDLVSFDRKHNEANGEGDRDGTDDNHSANRGAEGSTDDPAILASRALAKRNMLAMLFLSSGVPMLGMGDEISRSQGGNNNAYCQDNAVSWLDWKASLGRDPDLPDFVGRLASLRRRLPALRRTDFFHGRPEPGTDRLDIVWLAPEGRVMADGDWNEPERRVLGLEWGADDPVAGRLLLLVNASAEDVTFRLPDALAARSWMPLLDTADMRPFAPDRRVDAAGTFALASRSQVLFEER